jgi:hypothetical protein
MPTDAPPPQPPAAPPAPAKAGSGVLPKVLIGCLGLVVIIGIAISVAVWWGARKLTEAARNPAVFGAKLIVAGNPDLEIVSEDSGKQTVTIKNKKTGDVVTMNAADLKQGKIEFQDAKGEKVTFDAGDKGKGGVTVTSKEGTTRIGADAAAAQLPSWIPAYPGVKQAGTTSSKTDAGVDGMITFTTSHTAAEVLDFYEADLKGKGFKVVRSDTKAEAGLMGSLTAKLEERRELSVTAVPAEKETQVGVHYVSRGE